MSDQPTKLKRYASTVDGFIQLPDDYQLPDDTSAPEIIRMLTKAGTWEDVEYYELGFRAEDKERDRWFEGLFTRIEEPKPQ